jgi:hypothetical protein
LELLAHTFRAPVHRERVEGDVEQERVVVEDRVESLHGRRELTVATARQLVPQLEEPRHDRSAAGRELGKRVFDPDLGKQLFRLFLKLKRLLDDAGEDRERVPARIASIRCSGAGDASPQLDDVLRIRKAQRISSTRAGAPSEPTSLSGAQTSW